MSTKCPVDKLPMTLLLEKLGSMNSSTHGVAAAKMIAKEAFTTEYTPIWLVAHRCGQAARSLGLSPRDRVAGMAKIQAILESLH